MFFMVNSLYPTLDIRVRAGYSDKAISLPKEARGKFYKINCQMNACIYLHDQILQTQY